MRLFVDCDDTLVFWLNEDGSVDGGPNPYGGGREKWTFNTRLLEAILARKREFDQVIIWSGGGAQYAEHWRRYLSADFADLGIAKDPSIPGPHDLCVDDDASTWGFTSLVQTWQEFVAETEHRAGEER